MASFCHLATNVAKFVDWENEPSSGLGLLGFEGSFS